MKLYIALMLTFLPLYYSDNYYNILNDKRDVYVVFSLVFLAVLVLLGIIRFLAALIKRDISVKESIKNEIHSICLLDIVVLLLAIAAFVSTCLSADAEVSFTGEAAWDVGSGVIILTTFVYFTVSRGFSGRADIWVYIYAGTFAVLLIGVIDRLGYDFLVMHDEIPLQYEIFISTIGNVNFWSGYLSLLVPAFALAPVFMKSRLNRMFSYLLVLVAYFSCFITLANTTYIGIGCGMLYVVYFSIKDRKRWKNLAVNMILFTIAGSAAHILWEKSVTPRAIDTDTISLVLLQYRLYFVPGIIGVAILLYAALAKGEKKTFCWIASLAWLELLVIGACALIAYVLCNFSMELFNYRGSIWYFAWHGYLDGSIKDKLIGAGTGLLDNVTLAQIDKATFEVVWDYYYNTAHNDLLEYLVTTGAVGAVLRLVSYVLPFTMMLKTKEGQEYTAERAAVLAGLTGYIGQGLVTGPYVLNYVLYMLLLGMYRAYDRKQISNYE